LKQHKSPFKWRHFEPSIILLCVRWYCRHSLSYRDLEEVMRERGLSVDHVTIFRWVQRYAPEINKRVRPHLKMSGTSYGSVAKIILARRRSQATLSQAAIWNSEATNFA
jgi:transposase-like protein